MIVSLNKKQKNCIAASSSMKIDLYVKYSLFIIPLHGSFIIINIISGIICWFKRSLS